MKLALGFALHSWPTALKFGAFTHGTTPPTNNPAARGGQHALINTVHVI
jgi:hypothetical protein